MAETLAECRKRLDQAMPLVEQALNAIQEHRGMLASILAKQMHAELLASRRPWENRLLGQTASRWGLSPFALVLRIYQGLGNWALGALLLRPALRRRSPFGERWKACTPGENGGKTARPAAASIGRSPAAGTRPKFARPR